LGRIWEDGEEWGEAKEEGRRSKKIGTGGEKEVLHMKCKFIYNSLIRGLCPLNPHSLFHQSFPIDTNHISNLFKLNKALIKGFHPLHPCLVLFTIIPLVTPISTIYNMYLIRGFRPLHPLFLIPILLYSISIQYVVLKNRNSKETPVLLQSPNLS